jgi:hypothetical protein
VSVKVLKWPSSGPGVCTCTCRSLTERATSMASRVPFIDFLWPPPQTSQNTEIKQKLSDVQSMSHSVHGGGTSAPSSNSQGNSLGRASPRTTGQKEDVAICDVSSQFPIANRCQDPRHPTGSLPRPTLRRASTDHQQQTPLLLARDGSEIYRKRPPEQTRSTARRLARRKLGRTWK